MDKRNKKGPKIDAPGTPYSVLALLGYLFLIFTQKHVLEKFSWNHIIEWFENPREAIFFRRMAWLIVSNAFCKLMRIIPFSRPESKPDDNLSVRYESELSVSCRNQVDICSKCYYMLDIVRSSMITLKFLRPLLVPVEGFKLP